MVPRDQPEPWAVPVKAEADHWMNLDCFGGVRHTTATSLADAAEQFRT